MTMTSDQALAGKSLIQRDERYLSIRYVLRFILNLSMVTQHKIRIIMTDNYYVYTLFIIQQ